LRDKRSAAIVRAMPRISALFSHRIVAGTLAGYYGQFIQLAIQLLSLPILTAHWGLAGYGTWLILFTIPASLGLADLGLSAAGGNTMAAAATRGEIPRARAIYASLRVITLTTGVVIAGAVLVVLFVIRPRSLDFAQAVTGGRAHETVCLLLGYGFLSLINACPIAASRSIDAFASTIAIDQSIVLVEATCALTTALLGFGPADVARAYFLARLGGSIVLNLYVISRAEWLQHVPWKLDFAELRQLFGPAMAAMILPGAYAITVQGAVVAIGAVSGPAAVPVFTAVRTLSRTALQFAFRVNFATMPRYTVLAASHDRAGMDRLVMLNLVVTALLVVPAAVVILALGIPFIAIWTHHVVHPSFLLLALMVAAMLLNAAWVPLSNLILSVNHHGGFTYFFLLSAALTIGLGTVLQHRLGTIGMVAALVLQEAAMVGWVWRLGRRIGVIPRGAIAAAWTYGQYLLGTVVLRRRVGE
jgi:O-antigen/teichoic acid export membrane protein